MPVVVVDEHGHSEVLAEGSGHVVAVPARHDRRIDGPAAGVLDGSGQPHAHGEQTAPVRLGVLQQLGTQRGDAREHGDRALGDVEAIRHLGDDRSGQVDHGDAHVRGSDVDGENRMAGGVERELGGGTPSRGDGIAHRPEQTEPHQRVDAQRDRRSGEARGDGQF
jgi:hypothetical protein